MYAVQHFLGPLVLPQFRKILRICVATALNLRGSLLDNQGFVLFSELLRIREPLRKMQAIESDVMSIEDNQSADKRRIQTRWGDDQLFVRTYQGRGAASSVGVNQDPENRLLARHGYFLRSTGTAALRVILPDGLRKMTRNAIHLIPAEFSARQGLYAQRQQSPFAILIDGDDATDDGYNSPQSPTRSFFAMAELGGIVEKRFLVSLYYYDMSNPRAGFNRLSMKAALDGIKPVPPFAKNPMTSLSLRKSRTITMSKAASNATIRKCTPRPRWGPHFWTNAINVIPDVIRLLPFAPSMAQAPS